MDRSYKIYDIITNFHNMYFRPSIEHDYMLEFIDSSEPYRSQIVDYIISTEEEKDIFDSEECIVDDINIKVNVNYNKKVVELSKSGRKVLRLSSYRKIVGRLNPRSSYIS